MRVILGIGNPGKRYAHTRHNVGFMLLDYLASKYSLLFKPSKSEYFYCQDKINGSEFCLIKPTTFVNNSGITASEIIESYKLDVTDLLVICDDLNLEPSKIKIKISGGDGGHNGINSIIYHLNSDNFPRLRIGIGNNFEKGQMAEYVLSEFNDDEKKFVEKTFETGSFLVEQFIMGGLKQLLDANSKLSKDDLNNN